MCDERFESMVLIIFMRELDLLHYNWRNPKINTYSTKITKNQKLTEKQKTLPDILTENRLNRYFCITKKNTDESY